MREKRQQCSFANLESTFGSIVVLGRKMSVKCPEARDKLLRFCALLPHNVGSILIGKLKSNVTSISNSANAVQR